MLCIIIPTFDKRQGTNHCSLPIVKLHNILLGSAAANTALGQSPPRFSGDFVFLYHFKSYSN